jgi:hypothetical protein
VRFDELRRIIKEAFLEAFNSLFVRFLDLRQGLRLPEVWHFQFSLREIPATT